MFALIFVFLITVASAFIVMAGESSLAFNVVPFPLNKMALFMFSEMFEYSLPINLTATLSVTESKMDWISLFDKLGSTFKVSKTSIVLAI